jgi:pimeloyl-ACP methyl ester carboxylesterase
MRVLLLLVLSVLAMPSFTAAPEPLSSDPVRDDAHPPAIEELTLTSAGKRLPAHIYIANGPGPHPTVVLLHGFPGNEKNLDIAQALRRAGFNVLFFHYRGAWGAEGDYRITQLPDDVAAALAFLRDPDTAKRLRVDTTKLSLLGHSLGGWTSLAAGSRDEGVVCVGAMGPANVGYWKAGLDADDPNTGRLLAYADSLFMLTGYSGEVMKAELTAADMDSLDITRFGTGLAGKSVLLVTGDSDPVTPADTMTLPASEAYAKAGNMKLRTLIISGDHSFSWSRVELARLILDWARADCR